MGAMVPLVGWSGESRGLTPARQLNRTSCGELGMALRRCRRSRGRRRSRQQLRGVSGAEPGGSPWREYLRPSDFALGLLEAAQEESREHEIRRGGGSAAPGGAISAALSLRAAGAASSGGCGARRRWRPRCMLRSARWLVTGASGGRCLGWSGRPAGCAAPFSALFFYFGLCACSGETCTAEPPRGIAHVGQKLERGGTDGAETKRHGERTTRLCSHRMAHRIHAICTAASAGVGGCAAAPPHSGASTSIERT